MVGGSRVRRRGIYLLPNMFTTASLFSGFFYAIVAASNSEFALASIAIFVSMVLDGLDGRVARLTNTQSRFGEEYDSLADMVAFGVAPGLVTFFWILNDLDKLGWIVYLHLCGWIRPEAGAVQHADWIGEQALLCGASQSFGGSRRGGMVWCFHSFEHTWWLSALAVVLVTGAGVLMVSNVLYYSGKDLDLKGRVPFAAILLVVLAFAVVAIEPPVILFMVFLIYTLSGPGLWVGKASPPSRKASATKLTSVCHEFVGNRLTPSAVGVECAFS